MREGESLAQALEACLSDWSQRTGITVEIWALPDADVPPSTAQAVLAAMREALANVESHSGATTVSIAVTTGGRGLRLTARDHGRGFDPATAARGIARMRAAFTEIGGALTVNSVRGEGTTVTGVVPRRG